MCARFDAYLDLSVRLTTKMKKDNLFYWLSFFIFVVEVEGVEPSSKKL